ncbi:hypothetical protein [Actinopolyspora mortivallis]|uniref:Translation initiation factor 2 n=1 Tax=Actinopolyspora mortivallis TaxID=33906 RepID=A0A2T0GYS0_ACTMO|nr:hypothetical protein [Actinopolyspora mortivallis]PRW64262.1 hypothetical protein CEP50_06435 [Actinopolyspora mortivallis]
MRRRALGVVRTLTALDRLTDVLTVLADDVRVETRFTRAGGSEFATDLSGHFRRAGMRVVPWSEATGPGFDVAISPSGNGALHELRAPVLTLSHGAGHHKHLPSGEGFTPEVAGLATSQLVHEGRVVPSAVCLSHPDQFGLLARECPRAADRARVVGDPCFDRLRASVPARDAYRRLLGSGRRELVLLASTWGPNALFARRPTLAEDMVEALPERDYQVALVLHPNVWDRHSPWQIREWTERARRKGLVLVPPEHGWKATLVAADVVVSDHGSLGFYAAALGTRLLLAGFGHEEVVPGTPREELGRRAAYLCRGVALEEQVRRAAPVDDHTGLVKSAFAHPGEAAAALRRVLYELLDLDEPSWRAVARPVDPFVPE